tara:strand:+ start:199 stop:957 length:759 start_codon:yes stop_codon:yes gene_type:complete
VIFLIDTHAHIYYNDNIDNIINRALNNGVKKIISVGTDLPTSEECIKLAEQFPCVYATCGFHPHEAKKAPKRYLYELEQFYSHPKVVAVGEIGLDYHYNLSSPLEQKRVFHEQLEMASDLSLPSVVHCRNSDEDILYGIQNYSNGRGVIHCFSSTLEFAKSILELGFFISFTGMITFVKELEDVVRELPLEKLLVETDSPYLSPKPYRGKKNEPMYVIKVAEKIAELKNISIDEVAKTTTETACKLFKKLTN